MYLNKHTERLFKVLLYHKGIFCDNTSDLLQHNDGLGMGVWEWDPPTLVVKDEALAKWLTMVLLWRVR